MVIALLALANALVVTRSARMGDNDNFPLLFASAFKSEKER